MRDKKRERRFKIWERGFRVVWYEARILGRCVLFSEVSGRKFLPM